MVYRISRYGPDHKPGRGNVRPAMAARYRDKRCREQ
jgi:hypothetical protein